MGEKGAISKVLTIKQIKDGYSLTGKTLSGIIRAEAEDCFLTIFASFINFRALVLENYALALVNEKKQIKLIDLKNRPLALTKTIEDFSLTTSGFMAGVCAVENDIPLLVAVGRTENFELSVLDFKKILYDKYASIQKNKVKNATKIPYSIKETDPKPISPETVYDDEVVATENYYAKDYNPILAGVKKDENVPNEDVLPDARNQAKKEESDSRDNVIENEDDFGSKITYSKLKPYYEKAKRELEEVFSRFPIEEDLVKIFPGSKWCKVYYECEKYYVVGVIKENDEEKYICYGVPCDYSPVAPKELRDFCQFVPKSVFDLTGKGYWMMFQDAITGACVKKAK